MFSLSVLMSSIENLISQSKISKRSWVLHECMERMSERIDAMKELLEFGLHGTDLPALIAIGNGDDHGRWVMLAVVFIVLKSMGTS